MHILPLPFGMALALLARPEVERIRRPKPVWTSDGAELARERIRTESRYAAFRQRLV